MAIKITTFILCFLLVLPLLAIDCYSQPQSNCGINGTDCQYYTWTNGTCTPLKVCPTGVIFLNSTYGCAACSTLNSTNCVSCSNSSQYYSQTLSLCVNCRSVYGYLCLSCNSTGCLSCNQSLGNKLAPDNQSCVDTICNISFCVSCRNSSTCDTCDKLHKLYQGICVCQVSNCRICAKGTSICQECYSGYKLSTSRTSCQPICMSKCLSCNSPDTCTACVSDYYYSTSALGNSCVINCNRNVVPYCQNCNSLNLCYGCISGYSINQQGTACNLKCNDPNCQVCSDNPNNCSKCLKSYSQSTNGSCTRDICSISNCDKCQGFATCKTCYANYTLTNNSQTCTVSCGIDKCVQCTSLVACSTCSPGYGVKNGFCDKLCLIDGCNTCLSTSTCQSCSAGYLLNQDNTACNINCQLTGCLTCATVSTCATCAVQYSLSSGVCNINCVQGHYQTTVANKQVCTACPANCNSCTLTGSVVVCNLCSTLYFLNQTSGICTACTSIDLNCYKCQPNAATCTTCYSGYILSNNTCHFPPACSVTNCVTCSSTSTAICDRCADEYSLDKINGTCSKPVCPSGQRIIGGTCSCDSGYYQYDSKCGTCNSHCLICTSVSCSSCSSGFYPDGANCSACSSNCINCTTATFCKDCQHGYSRISSACQKSSTAVSQIFRNKQKINSSPWKLSLVNGQLSICPAGCSACSLDVSGYLICIEAQDHYVLVKGAVFICDSNCYNCLDVLNTKTNTYSYCTSCYNSQALNVNTCINCTDHKALTCSVYNASYSLTCQNGYTTVNGVCTACADHCLKCNYNGAGQCDSQSCAIGYMQFFVSTKCVKCFNGCTVCSHLNPFICLSCGAYKYLSGKICQPCPANCITCTNSSTCTDCIAGYAVYSDGSCKLPPGPPCVQYDTSLNCIKCDTDASFVSGVCTYSLSCNLTGTCVTCPYNYYISTTSPTTVYCLVCPQLLNCKSCNLNNNQQCLDCNDGYYLNSNYACSNCISGCATCSSEFFCNLAKDGYYLGTDSQGANNGKINTCYQSCATCSESDDFCLSCKTGYNLDGGHCTNNYHYICNITGYVKNKQDIGPGDAELGNMFNIFGETGQIICNLFGLTDPTICKNYLLNLYISSGSIRLQFLVDASKVREDPITTLKAGNLGNFVFLSGTSSLAGSSSSATSDVSLGLVLGVAIPLGVLLIAIIVIIKVKYSSSTEEEMFDPSQKEIQFNEQF